MTGIAGRYMSIERGAKACSAPSKTRSSKCRKPLTGRASCAITVDQTSVAGERLGLAARRSGLGLGGLGCGIKTREDIGASECSEMGLDSKAAKESFPSLFERGAV